MNARIDPLARQAEVGGRTYRLLLDCRAEAALVTVAGREYRVRLLQWREKAMLARLASLGEALVMREFVRMCADVTEELPPEAAAVLWEVAAWIHDPSRAGAGVPFDSRSVATVMLQLCKATQLRPADFDGRSALEVEEMWQALGGGEAAPAREVASASGTRIVIVPDGGDAAESGGGETPPGQPAGTPAFPAPAVGPAARWRLAHVRERATGEEPVEDRQSCLSGTRETGPNAAASGVDTPAPARGMAGYKPALLSVLGERTGDPIDERGSGERTGNPIDERVSGDRTGNPIDERVSGDRTDMEGGLIARHPSGERAAATSVGRQQSWHPQDTERRRLGGWPGAVSAPRISDGIEMAEQQANTPVLHRAQADTTQSVQGTPAAEHDMPRIGDSRVPADRVLPRSFKRPQGTSTPQRQSQSGPQTTHTAFVRPAQIAPATLPAPTPSFEGALALQPIHLASGAQSIRSASSRAHEPARAPLAATKSTALPFDHQSLFDELADRLAEAAAEMGIGEV
jgi:hypothetical protein